MRSSWSWSFSFGSDRFGRMDVASQDLLQKIEGDGGSDLAGRTVLHEIKGSLLAERGDVVQFCDRIARRTGWRILYALDAELSPGDGCGPVQRGPNLRDSSGV